MTRSNQPPDLGEDVALLRDAVAELEQRRTRLSAASGDAFDDPIVLFEDRGDGTFQRAFMTAILGEGPMIGGEQGDMTDAGDPLGTVEPLWRMSIYGDDPVALIVFDFPDGDAYLEMYLTEEDGGAAYFDTSLTPDASVNANAFFFGDANATGAASIELDMRYNDIRHVFAASSIANGAIVLQMETSDDGALVGGLWFGMPDASSPAAGDIDTIMFGIFDKGEEAQASLQAGPIVDADGTLADLDTKLNQLLAAMRAYGWLAE